MGEGNTKIFHMVIIIKRTKGRISCLKNNTRDWLDNQEDLKILARDFYASLYFPKWLAPLRKPSIDSPSPPLPSPLPRPSADETFYP